MPPAVCNGMESAGADNLHLIYLNIFKMLFNYTIHQNLPGARPLLLLPSVPSRPVRPRAADALLHEAPPIIPPPPLSSAGTTRLRALFTRVEPGSLWVQISPPRGRTATRPVPSTCGANPPGFVPPAHDLRAGYALPCHKNRTHDASVFGGGRL